MKTAVRCAIVLGACCAALGVGCAGDKSMSENKGDQKVVAMNKTCPVEGAAVDPAVTESYNGKGVGFCCAKCESKWNNMTTAQKDEALKKAMATK